MTSNERDALVKRINNKLKPLFRKLKSKDGIGTVVGLNNGVILEQNVNIEECGVRLGVLKTAPEEPDYSNSVVSKHSWHEPIPPVLSDALIHPAAGLLREIPPAAEPVKTYVVPLVALAEHHIVVTTVETTEELLAHAAKIIADAKPAAKPRKPRGEAIVIGMTYGVWSVKAALGHSRFECSNGTETKTMYAAELRAAAV